MSDTNHAVNPNHQNSSHITAAMTNQHFTKTELAILKILSDGRPHLISEMKYELDDLGQINLKVHISNMRKKLKPSGQGIVCVFIQRQTGYQHVRFLHSPYDGVH